MKNSVTKLPTVGILGAGKLGVVLGQLATRSGYRVYMGTAKNPDKIALTVETLVPGAKPVSSEELARRSDIVILALPLGKYKSLSPENLNGKLVIDAMNYWWEVDGPRSEFIPDTQSSSEAVQQHLKNSRVVKALNHMGYHNLYDEPKPEDAPGRKAIAIAGDDMGDVDQVSELVNNLGFDPLYIGDLSQGYKLEAGTNTFGANVTKPELKRLVDSSSL